MAGKILSLLLLPGALVHAANTWTGNGVNGSWNLTANWDSGPTAPGVLTFAGSNQLTNTNDKFAAGTTFDGFIFNAGAGAFVIGGNAITLNGSIINNSTSLQTINLDLLATAVRTVTATAGGGDVVLGGNISGTGGGITLNGTGSLTLSGNNSFTGDTTINAGTSLILGNKNALGSGTLRMTGSSLQASTDLSGANKISNNVVVTSSVIVSGSRSIETSGSFTLNNAGNRSLTNNISGGELTLNQMYLNLDTTAGRILTLDGTGSTVVKGVIADGGASHIFGIGGTATVTLESANTYTGGTRLSGAGATVILGNKSSLGTGTFTITANGNIRASSDLIGSNKIANNFTSTAASGPTFTGSHSLEIGGKYSVNNTGDRSITNNIDAGKALILNDIDLNLAAGARALIIAGTGDTQVLGTIADGSANANKLTVTNTGITTLSGSNTYTGVTAVNAGMLVFAKTSAKASATVTAGASGSIGLGVGGAGYYNSANVDSLFSNTLSGFSMNAASGVGIDTSAGDFTYATNQSAARSLTKLGANRLVLTGNNTYSGSTLVHAGTLVVSGSIGGSGVTVKNGGTLAGTGSINTSVVVKSGGTLSPGNSPGTLTQGGTTLEGGGNYNWQVYDAAGTAGVGFDTIHLNDGTTLTITATSLDKFQINLWTLSAIGPDINGMALNFDSGSNYSWTLFSTNQSIVGFNAAAFAINVAAANGTAGFANSYTGVFSMGLGDGGTDLVLLYTAIPEPSSWLLLMGGLTWVTVLRRRRA